MSYGLNVEMHKQTEIGKRLDAIIRQVLPFLSGEVSFVIKIFAACFSPIFCVILVFDILLLQHQQQVAMAVERAKQITMAELNQAMQVRKTRERNAGVGSRRTCLICPSENLRVLGDGDVEPNSPPIALSLFFFPFSSPL